MPKKSKNRLQDLEKSIKKEKREKTYKKIVTHTKNVKRNLLGFEDKRWSIGVILASLFFAFIIQSVLEDQFNPQIVQARVVNLRSNAVEAFQLSSTFTILQPEKYNDGHYIAPGDTDIDVFSFGFKSYDETLKFEEIKITKEGTIEDNQFLKATLYEGEDAITEAKISKGQFHFKNFKSIIQPDTEKIYTVKLDLSDEAKPGERFRFSIESPYDLYITRNEQAIYELDRYPIEGAYATVVGWRK